MRFSTRKHCATRIFKILVPATAIFILGLSVSFALQKGAQAENANNGKIYYFDKNDAQYIVDQTGQDLDTILSRTFGGEMTRCADHLDSTEEIDFYVAATAASLCDNYSLSADNAIQIQRGGYTYLTSNRVFAETDLGQSRQKSGTSNEFGTLGAFHIIAFNQLDATVQVYGNVATEELHAASNNNINHFTVPTLSYIDTIDESVGLKSFAPTTEGNNTSVIVIGSQAELQLGFNVEENGNTWTINRTTSNQGKVNDSLRVKDGIFLDNAWVDKDDQFLSLTSLKAQAVSTSNTLKTYPTTLTYDNDYYFGPKDNDHSELYVHIRDADGLNVINTTADGLSSAASNALDIIVDGFTAENNGDGTYANIPATLLLNVDLAGVGESYNQGFGIRICYNDRSDFADGSSTEYQDGRYCLKQTYIHDRFEHHVIINYYDSSSADGLYHGTINAVDPRGTTQFTIAPEATVHTHGTPYQGVIIANDVILGGDSYYLSLHDLQPLKQTSDSCTLIVQHKNRQTDQVILGYAYEYVDSCSDNERYNITKLTDIEDLGFEFYGGKYNDNGEGSAIYYQYDNPTESTQAMIENNETIDKSLMPVATWNDLEEKTITLYYDELCSLVVHHVNYNTGELIRDDGPITVVCNQMVEVGHASDLLDQGYIGVNNAGVVPPVYDTLPIAVTGKPTEATVYYKTNCTITVEHRLKGTDQQLAPKEEYTGFCGELSETIDLANNILNEYDFTSGIEVNGDTAYHRASDFPFETGPIESDKYYILEYAKKDTPTPENEPDTDTPNTLDRNPAFAFSVAGAIIGLGTAIMVLARRRQ